MAHWDDDEILIGEGVTLSTGAAPVTMRVGSGALDALIYAISLSVAISWLMPAFASLSGAWQGAAYIALIVLFLVAIPAMVETLTRGRSVGKLALGLRLVRDDGGPVSFRHALGRALAGLLEIYVSMGLIAVTVSVLSARGKRMGDAMMGTYAMRVRGNRRALPPVVMPPHLNEWASHADMRRLPDGLALNARLFLSRAATMHVPSRARIGTELSDAFRDYVSPEPPHGTHPENFIAAVLAARRDREYAYEMRRSSRAEEDMRRLSALPFDLADADN